MTFPIQNFFHYTAKILSLEKNSVEIEKEALLSIALVFPNSYEVAMANLGFQTLYQLFNDYSGVRCERTFFYRSFPNVSRTLESVRQLSYFDVIAFSISFELDYPNVVKILANAGLNVFAKDRNPRDSLVIAGGVTTFINPQPVAPFMDLFFIGEIEPMLGTLIEHLKLMKQAPQIKKDIIKQLAKIDGIYAPQFYSSNKKIIKISTTTKQATPQFSAVITPKSHFQNMFLIEVGRGCGRYCRFCAASHVYHPVRFFPPEKILTNIEENIEGTKKIGLIGAALGDYPNLPELCKILIDRNYQLGLSSFRFEAISRPFLDIIQQGGINTITLAPEAGTAHLRNVINKPLTDEQIMSAIELIAQSEIANLRLYFLIGLPFEEQHDITELVNLVKQIHNIFFKNIKKRRTVTVSLNAFIPKPFTPFQWCAMDDEKNLKKKRGFIKNELKKLPGIIFTRRSTRAEILQAILSRGDQNIANYLLSSEQIPHSIVTTIYKEKTYHDPLPWDFIAYPIKKERLWQNANYYKKLKNNIAI